MEVYEYKKQGPRGVVLVHGLNNNPQVLRAARDYLDSHQFSYADVFLAGHRPTDSWSGASYEKWLEEIDSARERLKEDCEQIYACGFSMGCALLTALEIARGESIWDGGIFFSPALVIRKWGELGYALFPDGLEVPFPSMIPRPYRAKTISSTRAYRALSLAMDAASGSPLSNRLIIGDPRDRMIDWRRLRRMYALQNTFVEIRCSHRTHHLSAVPKYLSPADWSTITEGLKDYLKL